MGASRAVLLTEAFVLAAFTGAAVAARHLVKMTTAPRMRVGVRYRP